VYTHWTQANKTCHADSLDAFHSPEQFFQSFCLVYILSSIFLEKKVTIKPHTSQTWCDILEHKRLCQKEDKEERKRKGKNEAAWLHGSNL
jgi:hypothetical protein